MAKRKTGEKKRFAILTESIAKEAREALEAGISSQYDLRDLVEHYCQSVRSEEGAPIELQRFIGVLLERSLLGGPEIDIALGRRTKDGRGAPTLGSERVERGGEICTYIAKLIAQGKNLKQAKEMAAKKFGKSESLIRDIWKEYGHLGIALYWSDRNKQETPPTKPELARMAKYCGKNVRKIILFDAEEESHSGYRAVLGVLSSHPLDK